MEVARLTLELKEAQMQRDDSQATKAAEQQTINSLQVSLVLSVVVKGECATFNAHT